jgi:hypothetical protein
MYIGHASDFKKINDTNPNLNFSMAPLPQIRSATYAMDSSRVYALALARTSRNPSGALTIASLIAAPPISTSIAKSLGMTSALRRVIAQAQDQSQSGSSITAPMQALVKGSSQTGDTLMNYEANISRPWLDPDPDKTDAVFRDMIENTVSGALKASEAVQRADKQLGEVLGI